MLRRRLVFSAVLPALPLLLLACGEKPQPDPRNTPALVRTAIVQDAAGSSRAFSGVIAARVQSDLGFRVAGKVLERPVETGQTVKRGQVLMRIDPADLRLAAQAQQEAVAAARARAQQTAQDEARYRDLRGTGAVSVATSDQMTAAAATAQAQLKAAEAQAEVARNASRYTELLADADGVVLETLAEPGQVVSAGQPVLRMAHAGRREALIQLPETLRPAIGSSAQASVFGQDDTAVPARLRTLSDTAERQTRTFEARYALDGALDQAPLGATVTIRIAQASTEHAMSVPIGALFDAGKGPGVWLVSGQPAKVSWRAVTVRKLGDGTLDIAGPLKPGDTIVALGAHLLSEGEQVRVAAPAAKPGAQP